LVTPRSSLALAATETVPVRVAGGAGGGAGEVIEVVGGDELPTVAETAAEVVWLPTSSVARAVKLWVPLETDDELQVVENGSVVSVATEFPSTKNWTLSTRRSSTAVAAIVVEPLS
jgi:hypothetical protein